MALKKKRKCIAEAENEPSQKLATMLASIADDEGKMEALIRCCESSKELTTCSPPPDWAKQSTSFFSSLNITPKEWEPMYDFPKEEFNILRDAFKMEDCEEKLEIFKNIIKTKFDIQMNTRNVYELLSGIAKIYDTSNRKDLGDLMVSGVISNLLDVLCVSSNIYQNGAKQSEVYLSDEIPIIKVRNDGFLSTNDITFLLREDESFDKIKNWHETGTDCHKLIVCLKSLLRKNMQLFQFDKSMMEKYSKVMGLSFLKKAAYLFILEASFEEISNDSKTEIIPKYSICCMQYGVQQLSILSLWLDIAYFIKEYVPLDIAEYPKKPYRPTSETPLKNLIELDLVLSTQKSAKKAIKNKKVIREMKDHEGVYIVQSASVIKTVSEDERRIILKLLDKSQQCSYLPQILNVFEDAVEFEFLQPLTKKSYEESFLLILACDVSTALNFLHSNNIVHRDVKPDNITIKKLNNPSYFWFVLIDFDLSLEKDETGCYEVTDKGRQNVTADCGTGMFKAPEVSQKREYDEKIDIYSLGATLLYLKSSSVVTEMYKQAKNQGETVNYQKTMKSIVWSNVEFGQMVTKMVDLNPINRPSALELENCFTSLIDGMDI